MEVLEQLGGVATRADLIRATSRYWGRFGDATYCEPLEVVRERPRARRADPILEDVHGQS